MGQGNARTECKQSLSSCFDWSSDARTGFATFAEPIVLTLRTKGHPRPIAVALRRAETGFMRFKFSLVSMPKMICLAGLVLLVGCTDGLLYKMKTINPYYRQEWQKDRELGVTFVERVDEIKNLQNWLPNMDSSEQLVWAERLEKIIKSDPSPELRTLAVQTIASIQGPVTIQALNSASTDDAEKVRLAACEAWRIVKGTDARNMLMTLANNPKETPSIRRAAIASLGAFEDADVKSSLARLLDDKSPAIQFQSTQSLKQITGKDYGGDIQAWRDFMQGKDVPEPDTSFMATVWETLDWSR